MEFHIVPVTPFQQNCSIWVCPTSKKAAIVDPGGEAEKILNRMSELKVMPEKIFITHAHLDHAGAAADLAETLHIPIEGPHVEDQFWIDGMEQQASMYGFPGVRRFKPDRFLVDGDQVSFGDQTLQVIHCPGHTPGHVVFFHREAKLAAVGDVVFEGSIGRTDFPKGDYDTLIRSIKEKLLPLGDEVRFIPGHGPMSDLGRERLHNPFLNR